jgi:hypothetical protein
MEEQKITLPPSTNGSVRRSRKGIKREWKDLPQDPLAEGFDEYQSTYIVGKTPVTWSSLTTGSLFTRSKSGKLIHCKLDAGHAIALDTGESLEIAPKYRVTLQVYKVTAFNSMIVKGGE